MEYAQISGNEIRSGKEEGWEENDYLDWLCKTTHTYTHKNQWIKHIEEELWCVVRVHRFYSLLSLYKL